MCAVTGTALVSPTHTHTHPSNPAHTIWRTALSSISRPLPTLTSISYCMSSGEAQSGPSRVGVSVCDIAAGMNGYTGVLEALLLRARTGRGSAVHTSLFASAAEMMTVPFLQQVRLVPRPTVHLALPCGELSPSACSPHTPKKYTGQSPPRVGIAHPSIAPYDIFTASDGKPVGCIELPVHVQAWLCHTCSHLLPFPLLSDRHYSSLY
jgi:hypothetical protein